MKQEKGYLLVALVLLIVVLLSGLAAAQQYDTQNCKLNQNEQQCIECRNVNTQIQNDADLSQLRDRQDGMAARLIAPERLTELGTAIDALPGLSDGLKTKLKSIYAKIKEQRQFRKTDLDNRLNAYNQAQCDLARPDLVIDAVTISDTTPQVNQQGLTINVRLKNNAPLNGEFNGDVAVELYDNNQLLVTEQLNSLLIAKGNTRLREMSHRPVFATAELHTLKARISATSVAEKDTTNNEKELVLSVNPSNDAVVWLSWVLVSGTSSSTLGTCTGQRICDKSKTISTGGTFKAVYDLEDIDLGVSPGHLKSLAVYQSSQWDSFNDVPKIVNSFTGERYPPLLVADCTTQQEVGLCELGVPTPSSSTTFWVVAEIMP